MHHSLSIAVQNNYQFELDFKKKVQLLVMSKPVNRGAAHAMKDDTTASTHEILHLTEAFSVDRHMSAWQETVKPNLPWAEDHFQERVGGQPLNPAPSEAWWPYARQGNAEHKKGEKFSHTYPERMWPKFAKVEDSPQNYYSCWCEHPHEVCRQECHPNWGIRYSYGDLNDLVEVLKKNPLNRQAYLPIWFPEDLAAAVLGERVPCSMGYHFLMSHQGLDCVYTLRSCDIVRFYRDDIYMAGRLLQWVCEQIGEAPGKLVVHIDNLHCFPGDIDYLRANFMDNGLTPNSRAHYNFDAMG